MSARWSPARKGAAVVLTAATGLYIGVMADNVLPHGADKARWEPAPAVVLIPTATSTTSTTVPAVVAATPPTTRCQEDMPCWNCHTMGNHVCGTLPRVP